MHAGPVGNAGCDFLPVNITITSSTLPQGSQKLPGYYPVGFCFHSVLNTMRNLGVRQIYKASASMQTIRLAYSNQYFKLFIVYFRVSSPALLPLAFVATSILAGLFCSSYSLKQGLITTVRWGKKSNYSSARPQCFCL